MFFSGLGRIVFLFPYFSNALKILTENVTVEYINNEYVDIDVHIENINNENVINGIFKIKVNLPESTKGTGKAFKWIVKDYTSLPIMQVDKHAKDVLEMELFDLQSLLVHHARPPIIWPIQKNVIYRIEHWRPDPSKFPSSLGVGRWKLQACGFFANKTIIATVNWFANFQSS